MSPSLQLNKKLLICQPVTQPMFSVTHAIPNISVIVPGMKSRINIYSTTTFSLCCLCQIINMLCICTQAARDCANRRIISMRSITGLGCDGPGCLSDNNSALLQRGSNTLSKSQTIAFELRLTVCPELFRALVLINSSRHTPANTPRCLPLFRP